jgi:hypothetical protein
MREIIKKKKTWTWTWTGHGQDMFAFSGACFVCLTLYTGMLSVLYLLYSAGIVDVAKGDNRQTTNASSCCLCPHSIGLLCKI